MKILLVADIHYALKQFDWLLTEAGHYDAVVLAGDLLDSSAIASPDAQIIVVRTYLEGLAEQAPVVVCSGNHDLDRVVAGERVAGWLGNFEGLEVCCDGEAVEVGDVLISALPWWDGPIVKDAIAAQLDRDASRRKRCWVWAHHAPPSDSPVAWGGARHYGDPDLRDLIERHAPDVVCSGHVHHAPFVRDGSWADRIGSTWCFNMGQQIGPVPCHIAFHLGEREALWFSMEGGERIDMDANAVTRERLQRGPAWL